MKEEVEPEMTKQPKITPSVLDAFDFLKSPTEDVKINGGAKILSILHGNESEKEIHYALKRLVRSLGANHPDMRLGYYATLTLMLKQSQDISVEQLLGLVKKELHASGSSKSEVGDVALGQILVCGAVFRSGVMLRGTIEDQTQIINMLFSASSKKSYLSIVSYQILLDFINNLDQDQFLSIVWTNIKKEFKKDLQEHNLDSLYFLMMVKKKFPEAIKLRKLIGSEAILCEDTVHTLSEKLMAGIDFNSVNHPIYKEIGVSIANSQNLQLFWTSGIDSQLVKHNRNRELVALNILNNILNNLQDNYAVIPELLSNNFFKLFMDWFKGLQTASKVRNKRDEEDDHKIMIKKEREVLNALGKVLKSEGVENKVRLETLKKLLFYPGDMNFSEVTGTSVTKSIIADLDADGVKKLAKLYKGVLLNTSKKTVKEGVERSWYNNERLKAAEGISYLVGHDTVKDDTDFKLNYMRVLMCFGFFKIGGDETVPISTELSGTIKTCFYRCFSSRFSNVDSLVEVLSFLCKFINKTLQKDQVREKMEKQFPKENMECWEILNGVCHGIEKIKSKSKIDKVFLILLYQLGLFLFSEPKHVEMATSSINELKSCYEHYKKGTKKKQKIKDDSLLTDEPEWIEVLTEVLLSILSTESSVLRSIVQCVFRLLTEHLTPSSLGQIVSVIDPENEANPLTEVGNDSGDESDASDEDEEKVNGDANEEESSASDDSASEVDNDDSDDDLTVPDQLRMSIQKALGTAANDTDTESVDVDMIDEEEGKKLDAALAEAFKQFHGGKNKKSKKERKDKKAVSDFRIRVLDLIDIYLEKDPSMDIALGMMAPLMRCLEFCIQDNQFNELEKRLRKTIKILTKIRKFSSNDNVTADILCDYLKSIIDKGSRSHFMFQALGDVITLCATFIIHCSQKIDQNTKASKKAIKQLKDIFKQSLQSYFQNRNCLLPIIFFHSILQSDWDCVYELIPVIVDSAFNKNVRQFRRNEAIDLLAGFYRSLNRIKHTSADVQSKISKIETEFQETVTKALTGAESEFAAKNNFYVSLRKLINTMKMYHESCHLKSDIDLTSLLNVVNSNKRVVKGNNNSEIIQNGEKKIKNKKKHKKRKVEKVNGLSETSNKRRRKDSKSSDL